MELRRNNRGLDVDAENRVGEDVAVPRSQLVHYITALEEMAVRHGVDLAVIAHAGDGNLHPTFSVPTFEPTGIVALNAALDESIDKALELGGTLGRTRDWAVQAALVALDKPAGVGSAALH